MKTLCIHPKDYSTRFLRDIYKDITNKNVIDGGITRKHLWDLMLQHDRIICCGHGSPNGLCANDRFLPDPGSIQWFTHIVDDTMVDVLSRKPESIYIFCDADKFIRRNNLKGFYTGFFISEVQEAEYWGFENVTDEEMDELNRVFAEIVGGHINEPIQTLYENVVKEYGVVAERHPIARYNWERLYFAS
ncbi:MAG TPA: hypothetical protein PKI34_01125 [Bacteroidales bacterium]|nr:hypothetical protein [Bacteroidales bacterium]